MKKISKQILIFTLTVVLLFTSVPFIGVNLQVSAIDSRVEQAVQTAVAIANDNSHGYSQSSRKGPDYDCSSLVYYAFSSAGISLSPTWFTTRNMGSALTSAGFVELTNINLSNSNSLQRGDILWKEGHTEIYIGNNQLVGAHSDRGYPQTGDQPGNEISVENYYYKGSKGTVWTKVYRYGVVSDTSKPTISNVHISNTTENSFKINCILKDDVQMSRVWFNIYANTESGYYEDGYSVSALNGNFTHTVDTSKYGGAGKYTIHMYAIDTAENSTRYVIDPVIVKNDDVKPEIKNVKLTSVSESEFTISCILNDDIAMSRVWFNVYANTETGYHEDGYSVIASNGIFSHTINTSKYGGKGSYTVHMYAIDTAENSTRYAIDSIIAEKDEVCPQISDVKISNVSSSKFTINCVLNDNVEMSRVWFNIYANTESGYYEDGYSVSASNGNFSHTINTSKYGGEGTYTIHMYAIDVSENSTRLSLGTIMSYDDLIVSYDSNGGSNAPASQTKKYNENITLSSTTPTRDGYTFLGWATDENATVPEYFPGDVYSENKDLTLYAVWEENKIEVGGVSGLIHTSGSATDKIVFEFAEVDNSDNTYIEEFDGNASSYSLNSLTSGKYILKISKENHVTREYEITIGADDVNLDVQINLIGDVNGDGKATLIDYTQVLKHVKKTSMIDGYAFDCADVNGDGKLTLIDYTKLLKHVKKTETLW